MSRKKRSAFNPTFRLSAEGDRIARASSNGGDGATPSSDSALGGT